MPRSASVSAFFAHHSASHHKVLTSDLAVSIRVPRGVEAPRSACEVDDRQSRALEIAPVQSFLFVIVVTIGRLFDLRDVPLDADQSDSYTLQAYQ